MNSLVTWATSSMFFLSAFIYFTLYKKDNGTPRLEIVGDHWEDKCIDRMFCGLDEWHFWFFVHVHDCYYRPVLICGWYNTHSDWLLLRAVLSCNAPGPIMEQTNYSSWTFCLYWSENLKPWPCHADLSITQSIWQGLGWSFSNKSFSLIK